MTQVERFLNLLKNNKPIAGIIAGAVVIVAVSIFTNAVRDIREFFVSWFEGNALTIVEVRTEKSLHFPIVDVKLRNAGTEVAYVNAIEFEVLAERIRSYENQAHYGFPSTWQYNVLFQPGSPTRQYEVPVSQVVPPNDVDRFHIVVGQASGYGEIRFVDYRLRLKVRYNQNKTLVSGPLELRVHSPVYFVPPNKLMGLGPAERIGALTSFDPRNVGEAAIILGVIKNESAIDALKAVLNKDPSIYIAQAEKTVLDLPDIDPVLAAHAGFRNFKVRQAVIEMYASVFWALRRITGDYHDELTEAFSPEYRSLVTEALRKAKQTSYPE